MKLSRKLCFRLAFMCCAGALIGMAVLSRARNKVVLPDLQSATYGQLASALEADPGNPRLFYSLGLRLIDLGKLPPARAALARAAELDPHNADICRAQARVALLAGDATEAVNVYLAYLRGHPQNAEIHLALALVYQQLDAPTRAYDEAITATHIKPRDEQIWRLAGGEALTLKRYAAADAAFRNAAALNPADWRSQLGLGDALFASNRVRDALTCFRQAAAGAPNEPEVQAELGRALLVTGTDTGQFREAETALKRAVALDPHSAFALAELADAEMRLRHWSEARECLMEAERLTPFKPVVHMGLIRLYTHLHDGYAVAREVKALRAAESYAQQKDLLNATVEQLRSDPAQAENLARLNAFGIRDSRHYRSALEIKLARLCASHGDLVEADRRYRLLESDPAAAGEATRGLADLRTQHGQMPGSIRNPVRFADPHVVSAALQDADNLVTAAKYGAAERAYQAMLTQHGDIALAWQGLGTVYRAQGRTEAAFRALNRALQIDPDLPEAQFLLAALYFDAGFTDESARRLETLVHRQPAKAEYFNALGDCQRDDAITYVQAEANYRRAVAMDPAQADYIVNLADMETLNNKLPAAEAHYRQALRTAPNSARAKYALGQFLLRQQSIPGREVEAEALLRSALAQQPGNFRASVALGRLLTQQGHPAEAVPLLENAVLQAPKQQDGWYNLARAYRMLRNRQRSTYCYAAFRRISAHNDAVEKAVEETRTHPTRASAHLRLARLSVEGGDNARAINQYQVYLAAEPADKAAATELQRVKSALKASGWMPDMSLFNQMVASSVKFR